MVFRNFPRDRHFVKQQLGLIESVGDGWRRADFPVRSNLERQRARVNYVAADWKVDWKVRAPLFCPPSLTEYD